jgi:thiol:disulfide interchange protein DsbA
MSLSPLLSTLRGLARGALVLAFAGGLAAGASAQGLVEGTNYLRIKNPQPVETGKNIEVIEFFSYGCPHCGELEPHLQTWLKTKPADVTFRRVPVMFQPRWENLARVYYTLEAMGEETKLSPEVCAAVEREGFPRLGGDQGS